MIDMQNPDFSIEKLEDLSESAEEILKTLQKPRRFISIKKLRGKMMFLSTALKLLMGQIEELEDGNLIIKRNNKK